MLECPQEEVMQNEVVSTWLPKQDIAWTDDLTLNNFVPQRFLMWKAY